MANNFNDNANKKNLNGSNISYTTYRTNYSNDEMMKNNGGVPSSGGSGGKNDFIYGCYIQGYGGSEIYLTCDDTNKLNFFNNFNNSIRIKDNRNLAFYGWANVENANFNENYTAQCFSPFPKSYLNDTIYSIKYGDKFYMFSTDSSIDYYENLLIELNEQAVSPIYTLDESTWYLTFSTSEPNAKIYYSSSYDDYQYTQFVEYTEPLDADSLTYVKAVTVVDGKAISEETKWINPYL